MSGARFIPREGDGPLRLEGEMDMDGATALWRASGAHLPCSGHLRIDLSGVSRADSAGVALLVAWTRQQRDHGGTLEFVSIPAQMRAIAAVSGVEEILPLGAPEPARGAEPLQE